MKRKNLNNIQESGFKIPQDYFENFEESIFSHASIKEKVADTGFSVPQDYFKNVEEQILGKVSEKDPVKVISLVNKKTILYVSSIAAAIVLLFNINIFDNTTSYDALTYETVENYILNEDIATEDLAVLFNDIDFSEENFEAISFTDEAMQDYIHDNLELNDLYIE